MMDDEYFIDDTMFINMVKMTAEKHGLYIDWSKSDIDTRVLCFAGDGDHIACSQDIADMFSNYLC